MELQASPAPAGTYQLFYRQAGNGGPAVVLMHGNPTHSLLWEPIMPALAAQYTVIAPDLLGYGQSQLAPPEDLTLPRQAEHMLALLDSLGIQQAHFIGHDLGGGIAQILALAHPERVLSIAIIDGVCFSNWPVPLATGMRWPIAPEFEPTAVIQEMLRIGVHNQSMLTPDLIAAMVEPYVTVKEPSALQAAAFALEHHQTEEVSPRMGSVTVPTTILWGQHDRHLPPYWGLRLHQAMPQSYFQVLPECGHFVMIDNPLMLTEQLLQHLQRAAMAQTLAAVQQSPRADALLQPQ
ncbi:MAG: alpha/beta hydrolase [Firmicutes bacterium]|nr:alpha/beta hydrolase [Bacillota bacterium]